MTAGPSPGPGAGARPCGPAPRGGQAGPPAPVADAAPQVPPQPAPQPVPPAAPRAAPRPPAAPVPPREAALLAVAPGPFGSVQDAGRVGWRRFGLTGAGAMDPEGLVAANALVGNPPEAACVEFAHAGGTWRLRGEARRIAVAGGGFAVSVDGRPVPPLTSTILRPGQVLALGGAPDAVWGYLAVAGGIGVAREFGSRSTHPRSGVGGLEGRLLRAGDRLPLGPAAPPSGPERLLPLEPRRPGAPVRVVLGPQDDHFPDEAIARLLAEPYRVTARGDRMAYCLEGPPLRHAGGFNIVSDGLLPGSIQVPGSGQPIVMLMDAQTTGGYPKIATVVSADLGRLAQRRPGEPVRFRAVGREDAQALRREHVHRLLALALRLETLG